MVFATFHARGAKSVDLKVDADNHAAIALYEKMDMERVETLFVDEGPSPDR